MIYYRGFDNVRKYSEHALPPYNYNTSFRHLLSRSKDKKNPMVPLRQVGPA